MAQHNIGIDISKDHLDAHDLPDGRSGRFGNSQAGFDSLMGWLPAAEGTDRLVYEATGPYHAGFERQFAGVYPLVKVNPLQARRFAQSRGNRAKTDAVDARMLAQMGAALNLAPRQLPSESMRDLKELQIARSALIKDQTRLRNRLQTQTVSFVREQSQARLALVGQQLCDIDAQINARIDADPTQRRAHQIIRSIPGIGAVSAAAILIEMPEIGTLNRKQAASLAGLAPMTSPMTSPMTRQSGHWTGNAFIQGGRHHLRHALYRPAISALRSNPDLKAKYHALRAAGKPAKLAITALMRKRIVMANERVKHDRLWTPKNP